MRRTTGIELKDRLNVTTAERVSICLLRKYLSDQFPVYFVFLHRHSR